MEKNQTTYPKAVCEKIFRAITFVPAFTTIRRISNRQQTPSSPAKYARNPSLPTSDHPTTAPLDVKTKLTSPQRPKPPASKEGSEVPINFDYTTRLPAPPTDQKPKPTALNGSTQSNIGQQLPLAQMAQHPKTPKPSTDMVRSGKPIVSGNGQQAPNKSKPLAEKSNGPIEHQANKEGAKKPTPHYDERFSRYIDQTKKKMSHDQESAENPPKLVGNSHGRGHGGIAKDHHFSDYIDQTKRKIRTTSSIKDRSDSFFKRLTFQ
ncbi:hypothetical protein DITRI_Ditri13aG0086700 [Diplodiscus trichospermus]